MSLESERRNRISREQQRLQEKRERDARAEEGRREEELLSMDPEDRES